ncbi:MAG: thiamine diphosphokinase [Ktedonobacteraceae bacterium]|nr:thiamine diphosphokinase [Ktedonobacteraceae bacterium]
MHIVIFAGGTIRPGRLVDAAISGADLVIAADRGAVTALAYGCTPAFVVGDFDSLDLPHGELEQLGSTLVRVAAEKDETDTELALDLALEQGATAITVLGWLGGERFEHTLANVLLLAGFATVPIRLVDGPSVCWLLRGPGRAVIDGVPGDLLSLFPLSGEARGVRTTNLAYPLRGEVLRFGRSRGISNVLNGTQVEVSLEAGLLLVVQTARHELHE